MSCGPAAARMLRAQGFFFGPRVILIARRRFAQPILQAFAPQISLARHPSLRYAAQHVTAQLSTSTQPSS